MINNQLVFLFFFLGIASNISAQQEPTIELAKDLKTQYEKEDVVILNIKRVFDFERSRSSGNVEVIENKEVEFMSISPYARIIYSTGYDNESEIEKLHLLNKKGRKIQMDYEDEAYSSESIFHNDYRIIHGTLVFKLQGAINKVKEEKVYKDIKYFTSIYLNEPYRVLNSEVQFNIPDWLDLELKNFNFKGYDIVKSSNQKDEITSVKFKSKNIKPGKNEYGNPGNSFIYPHLLILPKSFISPKNKQITLFKGTGDLYKWYSQLVEQVDVDKTEITKKVQEITNGLETDQEKIKAIYYWVQDNIKYIAFEDGIAGFQPDAPQNVYSKKYGDCKGMAFLLKTMLETAGFDSRLTWIGTDNIMYDYSTPSLSVDNHMIAVVMMNDEPIFIDGTEKFNRFGSFASRIQGKQAMIQNGSDFMLVTVPEAEADQNKEIYNFQLKIDEDDLLGTVDKKYTGEQISYFLFNFNGLPTEKRYDVLERVLTDGNENTKVSEVSDFDFYDRDGDLELSYDVRIKGAVTNFDNTYYITMDPVQYLSQFKFNEDRENPYLFSQKRIESKTLLLKIPEGYQTSTLPKGVSIKNEFIDAELNYTVQDNQLKYTTQIVIKKRLIPKERFDEWNSNIDLIKSFYDEQVILTK